MASEDWNNLNWLFSTNAEREALIQQIIALFREHWMTVTKCVIYVLMCNYFPASRSEPSEPAVKQVLLLVQTFGLVAVFVVPAITSTISTAILGSWSSVAGFAYRFLSGLAFYSMALWLVGHSGDDFYKWVLAHPNDTAIGAAVLAGLVISYLILWYLDCNK